MADLSQYGTVTAASGSPSKGGADLSEYGTIQTKGLLDHLKEYYEQTALLHPKESAQGLVDTVLHPFKALQSYGEQNAALAQKVTDSFKKGDYSEAARHSLSYIGQIIPGFGTRIDEAGTKAGQGDYGGAAADTAAIATDYVVGPKTGRAVLNAATEPGAAGKAVSAVTQPIKNAAAAVSDTALAPGTREVVGIFSPRAKHVLDVAARAKNALSKAGEVEAAVVGSPELDAIAQRLGAKDYASGGKALREMVDQIKQGQDATAAARAAQAAPAAPVPQAPAPEAQPAIPQPTAQVGGGTPLRPPLAASEPSDIGIHGGVENTPVPAGQELTDKLNNLLRQGRIEAGADPNLHLGEVKGGKYLNRFGGDDSPIIDSGLRKADSTAPIANPSKFKANPTITLHRGISSANSGPDGGSYYSTSRDFAREFTQSGQDSEIRTIALPKANILDLGKNIPDAGDELAIDLAKSIAKKQGMDGFYVNEGQGQPKSVFVVNKKAIRK